METLLKEISPAAALRPPVLDELRSDEGEAETPRKGGGTRRLLVLLHGEKTNDELVRQAIARLRSEGHQVSVRVTYEAGDVDRLVKEALALKTVDTLVAAGGDGTIQEVTAALLKHTGGLKDTRQVEGDAEVIVHAEGRPAALTHLSVAILPMGTSNDFAATTGLPQDPYDALLLATREDCIKHIDVGLLNGKVFMNTATIGASADLGKVTSSHIKKLLGPAAFLFTGMRVVRKWAPVSSVMCFPNIKEHGALAEHKKEPDAEGTPLVEGLKAEVPAEAARVISPKGAEAGSRVGAATKEPAGSFATQPAASKAAAAQTGGTVGELEGVPLLHMTAANNRQVASMVSIAPNALLDDGMLDCVYLTGEPGQQVRRLLVDVLRQGPHKTKVAQTLLRVPWLEVATEKPIEWSLDGEPMPEPASSFRFSLLHRVVGFHLPDDRLLVAGQPSPAAKDEDLAAARKSPKYRGNPFKLPRGRLHPPSLADMIGSVVRFRKKKNWNAIIRSSVERTLRTLLVASLGGLAVHYWHKRHDPDASLKADMSKAASSVKAVRRRGWRGKGKRQQQAVVVA